MLLLRGRAHFDALEQASARCARLCPLPSPLRLLHYRQLPLIPSRPGRFPRGPQSQSDAPERRQAHPLGRCCCKKFCQAASYTRRARQPRLPGPHIHPPPILVNLIPVQVKGTHRFASPRKNDPPSCCITLLPENPFKGSRLSPVECWFFNGPNLPP